MIVRSGLDTIRPALFDKNVGFFTSIFGQLTINLALQLSAVLQFAAITWYGFLNSEPFCRPDSVGLHQVNF